METKAPWQDYLEAVGRNRQAPWQDYLEAVGRNRPAAEAVAKLDAIDGSDPEDAHVTADNVLHELLPPEVQAAYARVVKRCRWWAYA